MHLGEVVPGVHVHHRERDRRRPERLLGQAQQHDRVLAAAEQQHGPLELGGDLADDVDRLGLEDVQVASGLQRRAAALGLLRAGPAALAAAPGLRAGRAADRVVAAGRGAGCTAARARGSRARGPARSTSRAGCTSRSRARRRLDSLRVRARRRLLAADAGDPGLGAVQRALERGDLRGRRSSAPARPRRRDASSTVDVDAVALLERAPGRERLREQHAGVDRDHARPRRDPHDRRRPAPTPPSGRSTASPAGRRGARRPRQQLVDRRRRARLDRAFALAPDHLERHVPAPVDEVVHRLEPELDRQREVLHGVLEAPSCRPGRRSRGTARPPRARPGRSGSSARPPRARAWRAGGPSGAGRRRPRRSSKLPPMWAT